MSADPSNQERRRFSRIPFEASVSLKSPQGKWSAKLLDISLNGLLITRPVNWRDDLENRFFLELHPPGDHFSIRMEVEMAHSENQQLGLHCRHIDLDSISHLRRLVELNLGDGDILNRELAELIE